MKEKIRVAAESDMPEIIQLCAEHAAFEKADYSKEGKERSLKEMLFSKTPRLFCLIAELDGKIIGYATYSFECSTWDAQQYVHMDCLYLREHVRGKGLGEKLIREIQKTTKNAPMQWQTPEWNKRAIKFYHRIGAISKPKVRLYLNK